VHIQPGATTPLIAQIQATLQAAFQSLIDQLELAPAADLDELSASFVASLTSLLTSIEPASTLPAISEPNGNGVAFEKLWQFMSKCKITLKLLTKLH
jgi:hypothetical protein